MNPAEIHLALNHLPVIGAVFAVLLLAYGAWRGSDELIRAALGAFVVVGVAAVAVYFTGEPAEEVVEGIAGVSHDRVEAHEEAALVATILAGIVGAGAFAALLLYRFRATPGWLLGTTLVAGLLLCGVLAWTASRGGEIRHPELREGFTPAGEHEGEGEGQGEAEDGHGAARDAGALPGLALAPAPPGGR